MTLGWGDATTRADAPREGRTRQPRERPRQGLTRTGRSDSEAAGLALRGLGLQLALVSTATRTRETFGSLGLDIPAIYLDDLYFGGTDAALSAIAATDDAVTGLLVVGHAPPSPTLPHDSCTPGTPRGGPGRFLVPDGRLLVVHTPRKLDRPARRPDTRLRRHHAPGNTAVTSRSGFVTQCPESLTPPLPGVASTET
ncbi:hypothetical protein G7085_14665 [Tessaracoccus sp. HDW20]|uniref:SixA phosphatase family protein n=1 Tax=Tessaracoccus coleopterorum TaxID=2714950 RepID=UPI0018D3EAAD|nr:hypothetical protein [Tessaracoccus coleopterorum]NHB85439.1 hypothetical protein [Tessaracoccus coleopterorum]